MTIEGNGSLAETRAQELSYVWAISGLTSSREWIFSPSSLSVFEFGSVPLPTFLFALAMLVETQSGL
jgi:uncharacterized membrane protein YphA (DoxX/SURF4 family)